MWAAETYARCSGNHADPYCHHSVLRVSRQSQHGLRWRRFDFDGGMTNSVLQYNYSHDSFGAGYLICQQFGAPEFANNVVRHNIGQGDGLLAHHSGIYVWVGGSRFRSSIVHNT